jgi:hypothetical protein
MNRRDIKNRDLISEDGMELIRRALRSGRATEEALCTHTGLHWIEVQAGLRLLKYHSKIQVKGLSKYHGTDPETMSYRNRLTTGTVIGRSTWGQRRKPYRFGELRAAFYSLLGPPKEMS